MNLLHDVLLASLLGQKHCVDVGQDTAGGNGHTAQQLAQLFIVPHSQLNVPAFGLQA